MTLVTQVILSVFLLGAEASTSFRSAALPSEVELKKMFARFQERYLKDYAQTNDDQDLRFSAFKENIGK